MKGYKIKLLNFYTLLLINVWKLINLPILVSDYHYKLIKNCHDFTEV